MSEQDTRKIVNEIRASFGAPPTTMTDEQIEAGREVYGAKLDYDMAVIDEVQDTREKLEADVASILHNAASHTSINTSIGDMLRYTVPGSGAAPWQTAEDACEALASIAERQIAELTAERDKLQEHKRRATMKVMRLEQEREQLDRRMAELAGKYQERLQQIAELRTEVDNLRKRNDSQADTIRRLRAEFDAALDDLARAVEDKRPHPF